MSFETRFDLAKGEVKILQLVLTGLNVDFNTVWEAAVGTATEAEVVANTIEALKGHPLWEQKLAAEKRVKTALRGLQPSPGKYAKAVEKLTSFYARAGDLEKLWERPAASYAAQLARFRALGDELDRSARELDVMMPNRDNDRP